MENHVIIKESSFEGARKKINENKGKKIIFTSEDNELNRKIIEKQPINILLLNQEFRKDKIKQKESGFNQVLAKIAKKNKISMGINLDEIIKAKPKQKSEIIGRIIQNIKLCNKNKINMKFITLKEENKRKAHELKALGLVLGMPTWMTKGL